MNNRLQIRIYNVGFGDCIYVRVPDKNEYYHILIDCGSSGPTDAILKDKVDNLYSMLPADQDISTSTKQQKKRLDLLVVTHPHADHIKGFDPNWFESIKIRHIWLSAFMEENHPQAKNSYALQALTDKAVRTFLARGLCLRPGLDTLLRNSIWNPGAMRALRETLPQKNDIESLYVCRDIADPMKERLSANERDKHQVQFLDGTTCLKDFKEDSTCLRILAPEWDIDGYYLGKESFDYNSLSPLFEEISHKSRKKASDRQILQPINISKRDFRRLCNRLFYSALAFSQKDDSLKNNTSVVLLLEWRGRRLLFVGDAEWEGKDVRKGHRNSCWDVMLKMDKDHLSKPIDFLKVGHHGSVNGTPFVDKENAKQSILDKILPIGGKAQVVVSTLAGKYEEDNEVPYLVLMKELGRRTEGAREYSGEPGLLQPRRTDKENEPWVDIMIDPVSD